MLSQSKTPFFLAITGWDRIGTASAQLEYNTVQAIAGAIAEAVSPNTGFERELIPFSDQLKPSAQTSVSRIDALKQGLGCIEMDEHQVVRRDPPPLNNPDAVRSTDDAARDGGKAEELIG